MSAKKKKKPDRSSTSLPDAVMADLQNLVSDMHEGSGVPAAAEVLVDLSEDAEASTPDIAEEVSPVMFDDSEQPDQLVDPTEANPEVVEVAAATAPRSTAAETVVATKVDEPRSDLPPDAPRAESGAVVGREVEPQSSPLRLATRLGQWLTVNWPFMIAAILIAIGLVLFVTAVIAS